MATEKLERILSATAQEPVPEPNLEVVQEVRRVIREVKARELANRGETLPNADTDTTGGAR